MSAKQYKQPKCKDCPFFVFTTTIGSPDERVWHCRSGFMPLKNDYYDCQEMSRHNERGRQRLVAEGLMKPDHEQLNLFDQ